MDAEDIENAVDDTDNNAYDHPSSTSPVNVDEAIGWNGDNCATDNWATDICSTDNWGNQDGNQDGQNETLYVSTGLNAVKFKGDKEWSVVEESCWTTVAENEKSVVVNEAGDNIGDNIVDNIVDNTAEEQFVSCNSWNEQLIEQTGDKNKVTENEELFRTLNEESEATAPNRD